MSDSLEKKDPRGLVAQDIDHLRRVFKKKPYTPNMTHGEIMYQEGINKVIDYIEDKVARGR